ncbi:IS701 family transposase [Streptomyces sp. NPDC004250]|uniref:IS701 family transposase n=1 Tax=Streptomyces sp. NPDC004250 TaxID=3364692 RepID=UPI0036C9AB23
MVSVATVAERVPQRGLFDRTVADDVLAELPSALFAEFRRKDQRDKAEQYLRGLVCAEGRKSVRNIAALVGGGAAEQSLHHFITGSTWDWKPLRAALAAHLMRTCTPQALVVQTMHIPKTGEHSVGVNRLFAPQLGRMFRGQQAFGVWLASQRLSSPVHWRLHLPEPWGSDQNRLERPDLPETVRHESLGACATSAALETAHLAQSGTLPVVIDLRGGQVSPAVSRFRAAGIPLLGRIGTAVTLEVADQTMPGFGAGPLNPQQILESTRGLRRPVHWPDAARRHALGTSLVSAVWVALPHGPAKRPRPMLLLGEWRDPHRPPAGMWLTSLTHLPVAQLLWTAKLAHRVEQDFAEIGEAVGLRDYVGRSFHGWHRHVTLASAAHAASILSVNGWKAQTTY